MSNELGGGGFFDVSGEALEPDVLAPDGEVESSSINPAFSKRVSNEASTFFPILWAARNGLSLDDVVDDDEDPGDLEYKAMLLLLD